MTALIGTYGKPFEMQEPIPGVYISPDRDVHDELARLFPETHFRHLWNKYPALFYGDER